MAPAMAAKHAQVEEAPEKNSHLPLLDVLVLESMAYCDYSSILRCQMVSRR